MNARGAIEIIMGLVALEYNLINETIFVSLVIMALVTSMTGGPIMKSILVTAQKTDAETIGKKV